MLQELIKKKAEIRKIYLQRRELLTLEEQQIKSKLIQKKLLSLHAVAQASTYFIYVSFGSEVMTHALIDALLKKERRVAVPLINREKKTMVPSYIKSIDEDLMPGYMNIQEPKPGRIQAADLNDIDVVISPGIVFSHEGWRLGYGGGFYDRFLEIFKKKSYALSYEIQLAEAVPHDWRFDRRVDYLVTEKRVIDCSKYKQIYKS